MKRFNDEDTNTLLLIYGKYRGGDLPDYLENSTLLIG